MRIFSGIQPTGAKHLGNYAGGFRQYATTQDQERGLLLHRRPPSVSVEYDPPTCESGHSICWRFCSPGLDPERSTIFAQSHVAATPEANWLLSR
jgi:tryptophanyl-tRNA synthetase